MKKKKGISLIVLVLTIVVIVILATAVILSIANNNPIGNASEAVEKIIEQSMNQNFRCTSQNSMQIKMETMIQQL